MLYGCLHSHDQVTTFDHARACLCTLPPACCAGGVGTITLRVDPPLKAMLLETLTGTNSYQYNPTTSEWHEPRTGDDLRGLLTRDLLAQRKGSPAWK